MSEPPQAAYERARTDLHHALAAGSHDVGIRQMQVQSARTEWIEQAAWAVAYCEGDLEDAIVELQKALNA